MTAILDLSSSTTAGLRVPVVTTTQRNAISSPQEGLLVFNSTALELQVWDGTEWDDVEIEILIADSSWWTD